MKDLVKEKYPEVKDIKENLHDLKSNTVELAQHVKKDGLDQIEEKTQNIKSQTDVEFKKIKQYIHRNPIQSICFAFAGGYMAHMLLKK